MLYCPEQKHSDHLVNSFEFIGFPDLTFDKEYRKPVESVDPDAGEDDSNLKYPEHRYEYKNSPMCVYIPSDLVLMKMMRACCYLKSAEESPYWIENCCHTHGNN